VRFVEMTTSSDSRILSGQPIQLRAVVELAGLRPTDVKVEAVVGKVDSDGHLEDTQVMSLAPVEERGPAWVFSTQFVPGQTGRMGYAMRVSPNHYDDPLSRPCYSLLRWGNR